MNKNSKIYVAGHNGLVGSAILKGLVEKGYNNVIYKNHCDLDLRDNSLTKNFFEYHRPEYVFLAAAKVGGIHANNEYPVDFLLNNLEIQNNIISSSHEHNVKKLMFLGSSCIYPRDCPQPIKEEYLLTGKLEKTNEPYAVAKIAGIKLCESYARQYGKDFISVMPTNLYGPNDNFDLKSSHVLPALLRKIHEAKEAGNHEVEIWGSGKPLREFLYVEDMVDACIHLMKNNTSNLGDSSLINIGTGVDISIGDLAKLIADIVGYQGTFIFNSKYPDGTPRKLLNVSRLHAKGWKAKYTLKEGIIKTYTWYLNNK